MSLPVWGLAGAVAIGLALGLLGSGGSIVTVPVLVYLFAQPEKLAIAGSLGVVGAVAAFGALLHARAGALVPRVAIVFAPASMAGAWIGAALSQHVPGTTQLLTFAAAMAGAALLMLHPPARLATHAAGGGPGVQPLPAAAYPRLLVTGLGVGLLTGFVGVGGGFLIVPALVLGAGLAMHRAVGTSLALIALTAFVGFARHLEVLAHEGLRLHYAVLGTVTALGIAGSYFGQRFGAALPASLLRRVFAIALLLLAAFMTWQTLGR